MRLMSEKQANMSWSCLPPVASDLKLVPSIGMLAYEQHNAIIQDRP